MQKKNNKELFTSQGLKNTKCRNLIYSTLEQSDVPITAEQVFLKIRETDAATNLSTVYRILEVFVGKGIAIKSNISENNKAVFELNRMEHKHHLVCMGCKRMFPMDGCPFEDYEKKIRSKLDFDVTGHKLEIYGYCSECKLEKN